MHLRDETLVLLSFGIDLPESRWLQLSASFDRFEDNNIDQTMPGMTGADLAKEIFKYRPNIKIILCTGHSDLIDKASAEALGISYFIYKPLNRIELGKVVRSVLDG